MHIQACTKQYKFNEVFINFGDTEAIFTTSQIFWGETCLQGLYLDRYLLRTNQIAAFVTTMI